MRFLREKVKNKRPLLVLDNLDFPTSLPNIRTFLPNASKSRSFGLLRRSKLTHVDLVTIDFLQGVGLFCARN